MELTQLEQASIVIDVLKKNLAETTDRLLTEQILHQATKLRIAALEQQLRERDTVIANMQGNDSGE